MQSWHTAAALTGGALASLGLLAGGAAYAARWPTSQLFGNTLVDVPDPDPQHHTIALTFDDGPSSRNTEPLLEVLAEYNVQATFFLIGNHVRRHPRLARLVASAGHAIGNHTDMHPDLARKSDTRIHAELLRTQQILQDTVGITPRIFRPPYGSRRPAVLRIARSLGLVPVLWNITAQDWKPIPAERILHTIDLGIEANRKRGRTSNLLLHDASHLDGDQPLTRATTVQVTRTLLGCDHLRFTTVDRWVRSMPLAADGSHR